MIQIIPSIAILNGKVVRLIRGDYSAEMEYNESPLDLAKTYEAHGIEVVHLVDLDGAQRGAPLNYHILEMIAGHTSLKVDFTGGIHTDGDIGKAYEYGATYITAASIAATNPNLFASWIISYGREKITLGADSLDHKIAQTVQPDFTVNALMLRIERPSNTGSCFLKLLCGFFRLRPIPLRVEKLGFGDRNF